MRLSPDASCYKGCNCSDLRGSPAFPTGCGWVAKHRICFANRCRPLKREQLPRVCLGRTQILQTRNSADSKSARWLRFGESLINCAVPAFSALPSLRLLIIGSGVCLAFDLAFLHDSSKQRSLSASIPTNTAVYDKISRIIALSATSEPDECAGVTVQTCGDLRAIRPLAERQSSREFALQVAPIPSNVNSYAATQGNRVLMIIFRIMLMLPDSIKRERATDHGRIASCIGTGSFR